MAGSRVEKFRTIYQRMQGLIRSGAVKDVDKPIWYDVYEAFPPKLPSPLKDKEATVRNILYHEDVVRAKFYKVFGNPDVADLTNEVKTTCQKFVDEYREQEKDGGEDEEVFSRTADFLRASGIRLRTADHIKMQKDAASLGDSNYILDADGPGSSVLSQLMEEMSRDTSEAVPRESSRTNEETLIEDT